MKPRPYDFRKPPRQAGLLGLRLAAWLRQACRLAGPRWRRHLPFAVELDLRAVEALPPDEALERLPEASVGYRVALDGGDAATLFAWPRPLVLALVAGALGDPGGALPADRELTPVEESLAEYLMQQLPAAVLRETWPGAEPLPLRVGPREPSPRWTRLFAGLETVLCGTLGLRGPMGEHDWHWLLPPGGALNRLAQAGQPATAPAGPSGPGQLEAVVRELPVEVVVGLGSAELSLSQLAALRPGDVVILDQRVADPLVGVVDGQKKVRGWPGRVGGRQALQIESVSG